ncbi:MAG: hypothetical protein D6706_02745 [Chloroflexi bacterium]|nr:MAG: hypothetical protein D6706_02745 [Chloroflexota bacterium]
MSKSVSIGKLQVGIIVLTLATAVIHLMLGINFSDTLFVLNGLGYLGLLGALYLPLAFLAGWRNTIRWVLIGYTALTIVLFFFVNPDPFGSVPGLVTKAIEAALIALLWQEKSAG